MGAIGSEIGLQAYPCPLVQIERPISMAPEFSVSNALVAPILALDDPTPAKRRIDTDDVLRCALLIVLGKPRMERPVFSLDH